MVDNRMVQRTSAPDPLLPAHLATKSYVDLRNLNSLADVSAAAPNTGDTLAYDGTTWTTSDLLERLAERDGTPSDTRHYGDILSSAPRVDATNRAQLANARWTFSSVVSTQTVTATTIRFYIAESGVHTGSPSVALTLYADVSAVATCPITATTLNTTGVKELPLSTPTDITTDVRYTLLFYVAPDAFLKPASVAATAAHHLGLASPTPSQTYTGHKSATAPPPPTLDTGDGTWTPIPTVLWWSMT